MKNELEDRVFLKMYMKQNLGDDLFLRVLLQRYPEAHFFMYASPGDCRGFLPCRNLIVRKPPITRIRAKLGRKRGADLEASRSKATLLLGGSMFVEPFQPKLRNDLWKEGLPFFVLGVSYGPAATEEYKETCRAFFRGKTDICFRDRASYKLFKENPAARVETDIIFGMRPEELLGKRAGESAGKRADGFEEMRAGELAGKPGGLFVSVIDYRTRWVTAVEGMGEEERQEYLGEFLPAFQERFFGQNLPDAAGMDRSEEKSCFTPGVLLEQKLLREVLDTLDRGEPVVLASFCDTHGDWKAVCRLLKDIESAGPERFAGWRKDRLLKVYRYRGEERQERVILREMATADRVIGGRYHSLVLGLLFGRPVLPICYDLKSENLLDDLGMGEKAVRLLYADDRVDLSEQSGGYVQLSPEKLEELRESAKRQFARLDEYFRSGHT